MPDQLKIKENVSDYSDELQEIIGRPPGSIVQSGTFVMIIVLIAMLGISFFVRYADTLSGSFTLAASNAPKTVKSKIDGKLLSILTNENDHVEAGQIIGYIESTASHREVIKLFEELNELWEPIQQNNWMKVLAYQPGYFKNLGELQSAFQVFITSYIELYGHLNNGMQEKRKELLKQEMKYLSELNMNLLEQEKIHINDYQIAEEDFAVKSKLYKEKVIAYLEYRQEESKMINKSLPIGNVKNTIIQNNAGKILKEQELIQLEQQSVVIKNNFIQALNTLLSNIEDWNKKYLLTSPVSGTVSYPSMLQEGQDLKADQVIYYIQPPSTQYYGEVKMAQDNFGKVRIGQPVLINLAGFPYQEYGKLKGKVSYVSNFIDENEQYLLGIQLEKGLETDREFLIEYRNGLTGTAEIVTRKTRLIYKLVHTIRQITEKPKVFKEKKPGNQYNTEPTVSK